MQVLILVTVLVALIQPLPAQIPLGQKESIDTRSLRKSSLQADKQSDFGKLVRSDLPWAQSLGFIENKGQIEEPVRFYHRRRGRTFWFTPEGVVFDFVAEIQDDTQSETSQRDRHSTADSSKESTRLVISQRFVGGYSDRVEGRKTQPTVYNFFMGGQPSHWQAGIQSHAELVYQNVWPAIDVKLYFRNGHLEQEFIVKPGGNPAHISVEYDGVEQLAVTDEGSLVVTTGFGEFRETQPQIFQEINGKRARIKGSFELIGKLAYRFNIGEFDPEHSLVIDPTLLFSTFLGGSQNDEGRGIAVDENGNIYVTGFTNSLDFPTTTGTFPCCNPDAFVAKLDATGENLIFTTFLGGINDARAHGIALDSAGNIYITGDTKGGFPVTAGAFDVEYEPTPTGLGSFISSDAFAAKLDPLGQISYATYLGGNTGLDPNQAFAIGVEPGGVDVGLAIAVDATGNAYVTGETTSDNFPTTTGAFSSFFNGGGDNFDAFVVKVNPTGSDLVYATYLGGSVTSPGAVDTSGLETIEGGIDIVVDAEGNSYVTGSTTSLDFPTTAGVFRQSMESFSASDAFVTKFDPNGTVLYSTYVGGGGEDIGAGIRLASDGTALLTGSTSGGFPTTTGSFQIVPSGGTDVFLAEVNSTGTDLTFATYLGGTGQDFGLDVTRDTVGNIYVVGQTNSSSFPVTADAIQSENSNDDIFITVLDLDGANLLFSTFLGGSNLELALGVAVDSSQTVYVAGTTQSTNFPSNPVATNFPTTPFAFQVSPGGLNTRDGFVVRLSKIGEEELLLLSIEPDRGGDTGDVTALINGSGFMSGATVILSRPGQTDILAAPVTVEEDGRSIQATFDLRGKELGSWDVVVVNPDGASLDLPGVFTIEEGRDPRIRLTKVGTTPVPGRVVDYFVLIENPGNIDKKDLTFVEFLDPWFTFVSADPLPFQIEDAPDVFTAISSEETYKANLRWRVSLLKPGEVRVISYRVELDALMPLGVTVTGTFCEESKESPFPEKCDQDWDQCLFNRSFPCNEQGPNDQGPGLCVDESAVNVCRVVRRQCLVRLGKDKNTAPPGCTWGDGTVVGAKDPNEKLAVANRFISPDQTVAYAIHFENIGTLEAIDVFVTDVLDANLDSSTLKILSTGASFDPDTRTLRWELLERNLQPTESDNVLFSIKPLPGLPSGTEIRNSAEIQFEVLAPLVTEEVVTIIDSTPPVCLMDPLPPETAELDFSVSWTGGDPIGEIETFSVFVSVNSGEFVPFLGGTVDTSAVFNAEVNNTYSFFCLATDTAGNEEIQEAGAETTTTVIANQPPVADAGPDQTVECSGPDGATVLLDGSASSDPNRDPLTFSWGGPFGTASESAPTVTLPLGTHTITLIVDDGNGLTALDQVLITVQDTTAPIVTASLVPAGEVEEDEGRFQVNFGCADSCSGSVSTSAHLNGIPVASGQIVDLDVDEDTEIEEDDGVLDIEALAFELVVGCTDAAGNLASSTATPPFASEAVEFCTYNLDVNIGDTFNILDYVQTKDGDDPASLSDVFFTYTGAGANDPTTPLDWNLDAFNAGQSVTAMAEDVAPDTGNHGQGEFRVYVAREGQPRFDDHMTIRVSNDRDSEVEDAKCDHAR